MHFVIMGCGRVGAALTVQLAKAGHTVSIIDKRKEAFDRLPPEFTGSPGSTTTCRRWWPASTTRGGPTSTSG